MFDHIWAVLISAAAPEGIPSDNGYQWGCREDLTGWQEQCSPTSSDRESPPPCKKPFHTYFPCSVPTPLLGNSAATSAAAMSAKAAAAAELGKDAAALKLETSRRSRSVLLFAFFVLGDAGLERISNTYRLSLTHTRRLHSLPLFLLGVYGSPRRGLKVSVLGTFVSCSSKVACVCPSREAAERLAESFRSVTGGIGSRRNSAADDVFALARSRSSSATRNWALQAHSQCPGCGSLKGCCCKVRKQNLCKHFFLL